MHTRPAPIEQPGPAAAPAGRPVPCVVDVPEPFRPKARHALRMLLRPLGLEPAWAAPEDAGETGLYYGRGAPPPAPGRLVLAAAPHAWEYFQARRPLREPDRWVAWEGERWPAVFAAADGRADLVASAFFWLSGWQEHVEPARDEKGRFSYHASAQQRWGGAERPAADACREWLAAALGAAGIPVSRRRWHGREWALCPTHDVDSLRKWRAGTVYRELVEHFLLNRRGVPAAERRRRLVEAVKDAAGRPDTDRSSLVRLAREERALGVRSTFFLKTDAPDPHDVPYDPGSRFLRRTVARLEADGFEIGLHPSYQAHNHGGRLEAERLRLSRLVSGPLTSVRQHYLRYEHPVTARLHEALGFGIDSTLGFPEHEGFRNGTCLPFQLYDLHADRPLDLWEMPLSLMDATLFGYRGLDPDAAHAVTRGVLDRCRRFGGVCVALWHNTIDDRLDCPGLDVHFRDTLREALDGGAYVGPLRDALGGWQGPARPDAPGPGAEEL